MFARRSLPVDWSGPLAAFLAVLLLLPGAGRAADTLGLWFDTGYSVNEDSGTTFPFFGTMYLVLHEPSATSVGGWECRVATDGPASFLTWDLEGLAVNFENPPSFTVGLGAPLPPDTDVLLATAQFMVTDAGPVAWSLNPTYHPSIAGHMAYIPYEDPNILLPLETATGWPEVAWYNPGMAVCYRSTGSLVFGSRPVGGETQLSFTVRNDGGGTLWIDPQIDPACEGFRVVSGGGLGVLHAGEIRLITVGFLPVAVADYACELTLGTDCDPLPLSGSGREPFVSGTVSPNPADFGEVAVGATGEVVLSVRNTGEVPLDIQIQPADTCQVFSFGATAFTVPVGTSTPLHVFFAPPTLDAFSCRVTLNDAVPDLVLRGSGRDLRMGWSVSPTSLDFGTVLASVDTASRIVGVRNTGDGPQALDISLNDPSGAYSVLYPANLQPVIPAGGSTIVRVGFAPTTDGPHGALLTLGGGAPYVSLYGIGVLSEQDCAVSPVLLDFGEVPLGGSAVLSTRVVNTGDTRLDLAPSADCPQYGLDTGPTSLYPGESRMIAVTFQPTAEGRQDCVLSLGPSACASVVLSGTGVTASPPPAGDQVAVSFDPDVLVPQTYAVNTPVDAYIMMIDPSRHLGVWAWELKLTYDQDLVLNAVDLPGQSYNFVDPPEFVVGLATPLPDATQVILAHLTFTPLTGDAHSVAVGPVHKPSLPGSMAWAYDDNYDLAPLYPVTGESVVAMINGDLFVAVEAPAPVARLTGGRIELTWPLPADGADGCHVYRTVDGRETRLTAQPLPPRGTGYAYADEPAGLPAGAQLGYSYAVVRGGTEVARSPQVTVELPAAAVLATRLLENRPNPFNPETEIPFELARAARIRIAVYDLTGRRVAVLADGERAAGRHHVTWRGRDDAGRAMPSGAYYVRLETATTRDTRKVMLLK